MQKGYLLLLLLIALSSTTLYAQQPEAFSADSATFIKAFEDFVETNITEENEVFLDQFINHWEQGQITEEQQQRIMATANLLLANNARRKPHFIPYVKALSIFLSSELGSKNFADWDDGIRYIVTKEERPLRKMTIYLQNAAALIKEGTIRASFTIAWKASTSDFAFEVKERSFFIRFPKTDLTCKIKEDSITIYNTSGRYDPISGTWHGEQGRVTWERAGYPADQVYARLPGTYQLQLNRAKYELDSVRFVNKLYLDEEMLGEFSDEVTHIIKPTQASYPQFSSYKKYYEIPEIYPDIDFRGGLSMKGANLMGTGTAQNRALLAIKSKGATFLEAQSEIFLFGQKQAVSTNTQVNIRINGDSIYHPGIGFNYSIQDREVSLSPSERMISQSPYYDSYHAVSINIDRMLWRQGEDKIYLTTGRNATAGNGIFT